MLHIRLRILGALFKRMVDKAGLGACYHLYSDLKRDLRRLVLNDDEKDWLGQNGVPEDLPDWRVWQRSNTTEGLRVELLHLRALTTKERRTELRLLHGGRMRRIQDDADAGKIGAVIKTVMARSPTFSLDVIYGKEENIVDADEIARIVTEFFALWFNATEDDDARDAEVAKCTTEVNEEEWRSLATKLNIPWQHAKEVLDGMVDKPICKEARIEGLGLDLHPEPGGI